MGCPLSSSITSKAHKKGSPTCLSLLLLLLLLLWLWLWWLLMCVDVLLLCRAVEAFTSRANSAVRLRACSSYCFSQPRLFNQCFLCIFTSLNGSGDLKNDARTTVNVMFFSIRTRSELLNMTGGPQQCPKGALPVIMPWPLFGALAHRLAVGQITEFTEDFSLCSTRMGAAL